MANHCLSGDAVLVMEIGLLELPSAMIQAEVSHIRFTARTCGQPKQRGGEFLAPVASVGSSVDSHKHTSFHKQTWLCLAKQNINAGQVSCEASGEALPHPALWNLQTWSTL